MNSLHSIPRERSSMFGLTPRQIKIIRAFRRAFTADICLWYESRNSRTPYQMGYRASDTNSFPENPTGFNSWTEQGEENWETSFDNRSSWVSESDVAPEFDPAWIKEIFYVT